ncbi:MAG: response regulator [Eubacteriales bacterium]|nr:response regulator [Eubacteriales bacterium]
MKDTKKILIVDDNETFRNILAEGLRKRQCVVEVAFSIEMAKAMLKEKNFSVICVDVQLPDENGFELFDYIRANKENQAIIVMSSSLSPRDNLQARLRKAFCVSKCEENLLDIIKNYEN